MEIPKEHVENPQVFFFNNFGENPSLNFSNDFLRNFKELSQQIQEERRLRILKRVQNLLDLSTAI